MSSPSITVSTELLQGYVQAEILAPDASFQALQTQSGASLLFSLGTDSAFYVTQESPGTRSGWARTDVSGTTVGTDFPNNPAAACTGFSAAQQVGGAGASIHLAMTVTDGTNDHLYLSLGNSDSDTSWTQSPTWSPWPYDNPDVPLSPVRILGVQISEATDGEVIVVDVVRQPAGTQQLVSRYYIDTAKTGGYAWHVHDVTIDLDAAGYSTCLGRRAGQTIDGLYTAGQIDGSAQMQYQPLYNVWKPAAPANPALYSLPGGAVPEAIAACRNLDNTSDLFVTSGGTLYHLASTAQQSGAVASAVLTNSQLSGIRSLFAATDGNAVIVWGLNGSDEVVYVTCPQAQLGDAAAWSVPLPILTGVEQVTPYLDRANSANTFFAHTGQDQLVKATKSPGTSIWSFQSITLDPPSTTTPATRFSSYTTRILVLGEDGQPAPNTAVTITASAVTPVHINSLYYVIGPVPVQVTTDVTGVVMVVEPLTSVAGARLTVTALGASVTVNPMDAGVSRAVALTTPAQLTGAKIVSPDGSTTPLVPAGASSDSLTAVAAANAQLAQAYAAVSAPSQTVTAAVARNSGGSAGSAGSSGALESLAVAASGKTLTADLASLDSILVDAGDLFSWIAGKVEAGVDYVVQVVKDAASEAWAFLATIAGEAYHCILDCAEKVAGAATWLYGVLKTAAEDLLHYLEYLFDWADITRTKGVLFNLIKVTLQWNVDQIEVWKTDLDGYISDAVTAINGWAGVGDWSGLGTDATSTPNDGSTPEAGQSSPGSLLSHHFQANASGWTPVSPLPPVQPGDGLVDTLVNAIEAEGTVISNTITSLQSIAGEVGSTPLEKLLEQLVATIADGVLESAQVVMDALLNLLYDVANDALAAFDTPIHIPVVSDILAEIGIPEFSILDIVCWVGAVPVTIAYKIAAGAAPFPDDADTTFLMTAPDLQTLQQAFAVSAPTSSSSAPTPTPSPTLAGQPVRALALDAEGIEPASSAAVDTVAGGVIPTPSPALANAVHLCGHLLSGFVGLVNAWLTASDAADPSAENQYAMPSAAASIVSAGLAGGANFLAPHDPIKNTAVNIVGYVTLGTRIVTKLFFSSIAQGYIKESAKLAALSVENSRGWGSIVDSVLVIPAYACTGWHFYELSQDNPGATRSIAIIDETSTVTSGIARVSYCVAVNVDDPDTKAAMAVVTAVASVCTGGLQIGESFVGL